MKLMKFFNKYVNLFSSCYCYSVDLVLEGLFFSGLGLPLSEAIRTDILLLPCSFFFSTASSDFLGVSGFFMRDDEPGFLLGDVSDLFAPPVGDFMTEEEPSFFTAALVDLGFSSTGRRVCIT